jgi:hypothetical protein
MKECDYCGRQDEDAAAYCSGCGLELKTEPPAEPLPKLDDQEELVTLATFQRLTDADLAAGRLEAAGIEVFLPDEMLMQTIGFNLNTYGYVQLQVHRKNLAGAKELLAAAESELPKAENQESEDEN